MSNNCFDFNTRANLPGMVLNTRDGSDQMTTSEKNTNAVIEQLRGTLTHVVTAYDRRQAKGRGYYNPNALALYLGAVNDCCEYLKLNPDVLTRDAIDRHFEDRLRDACLRRLGFPVR